MSLNPYILRHNIYDARVIHVLISDLLGKVLEKKNSFTKFKCPEILSENICGHLNTFCSTQYH